jgi:indole-3-glycerol phosphate synthase
MADILDRILATKRREVADAALRIPLAELKAQARDAGPVRDFVGALREKLRQGKPAVIAEIKRASPSAGEFRRDLPGTFDPAVFAESYQRNGAACLSVLTDREYFRGTPADLVAARSAALLPVLRKDFMVAEYQVFEARAMGADAILLIMGTAPLDFLRQLESVAMELGLAVLAESHHAAELEDALALQTPLIGINNRDLTRFVTDVGVTLSLKDCVGPDRLLVTESGISSPAVVAKMLESDVNSFLIGGALMSEPDPGAALSTLFSDRLI